MLLLLKEWKVVSQKKRTHQDKMVVAAEDAVVAKNPVNLAENHANLAERKRKVAVEDADVK